MYTKNFFVSIILNTVLLTGTVFLCAWVIYRSQYLYLLILMPLILAEAASMIVLFNRTNRKITYFFNAIRNEDTTLLFPEKVRGKTIRELHRSLNRVNRVFARARETSETNEHFYRTLIGHARTGLLAFDREGRIEEINPAMKKIFSTYILRHIRDFDSLDPRISETMTGMKPGKPEILSVSIENELNQLLFNKAIVQTGSRNLSIISVENIKNELEHKELDSWVRLIRVLNHEIINAVTPITTLSSTFSDLFRREEALPGGKNRDALIEDAGNAFWNIHDHGASLINFVNSYRQITRLPDPVLTTIDLDKFIRQEVLSVQNYPGGENVSTRIDINPGDLTILGDPELLQRVFSNILINAVQAMDDSEIKEITISAFRNHQTRVIVQISDTGTGIADDIIDQIFVPFFTTRDEGSGIGLSLSRQIMHLHNGNISITSQDRKGTIVTLMF